MANVDGVRITLPDGTEFFGEGDIQVQIEHQNNWLLAGGNTVIGVADWLSDNFGGFIQTPLASGHIGAASGSRTFEISFIEWDGGTNTWGPLSSPGSEPIEEKLAVLDMEIARSKTDSLNPAELEFGPFSSGTSRYDPVPVVFPQLSPTLDFGENANTATMRLTAAETVDLTQEIDGATDTDGNFDPTPDYVLSASEATDDVPISADTLGPGGRGTGRQQQGYETSPSGLAEKNADSASTASPTTQGTKILPASVQLRGAFRGSNAASLADRLRSQYLSNPDVDTVTLSTNLSGTNPLTGTYVLGSGSEIDPLVPQAESGLYGFTLDLQEA